MPRYRLLGMSGSLRAGSFNRMLLKEALRLFDPETSVTADLDLPLYNGDDEARDGLPDKVRLLKRQVQEADGIVISSPEYNKGVSGVMKNALDWLSRDGMVLPGKPVAVISANAGRTGGETGQYMLRACLWPHRPRLVAGPPVMVAGASKEFDEDGRLLTETYLKALTGMMDALRDEIGRGA